jgi:hypothetical protein
MREVEKNHIREKEQRRPLTGNKNIQGLGGEVGKQMFIK